MRATLLVLLLMASPALAADGEVDTGFGIDGHVVDAPADASHSAYAIATTSNGRLLIGGSRWDFSQLPGQNELAVWRLQADGAVDTGFGDGGHVWIAAGEDSAVFAIAAQPDGGVLAAGNVGGFGVVRLLADGSRDDAFGNDGIALVDLSDLGIGVASAFAVATDAQGHIVLAGSGSLTDHANANAAIAVRLLPNGSLDTSFGNAGRRVLEPANADDPYRATLHSVAVDAAGRIWLSGAIRTTGSMGFLAARLDAIGTLDATFGNGGIVTANLAAGSDDYGANATLRDGRWTIGGTCAAQDETSSLCLLRLREDGSLDPTFGEAGWSRVAVGARVLPLSALACQHDGRCIVLGTALDSADSPRQFVAARVDADGNPDATFGVSGLARIAVPASVDGGHIVARSIAMQGTRPVLAGTTDGTPYVNALFATRLLADRVFGDGFD